MSWQHRTCYVLILSKDELGRSEFLKVSVIHLQVFPVIFSLWLGPEIRVMALAF